MLKKALIYTRTSMRIITLFAFAIIIIIGIMFCTYKPTYSVNFGGEFIGYCDNKNDIQSKINDYIENGDSENVAFVQIDNMPEYDLCLLKKEVETNDDEILEKVLTSGTKFYKMYALVENGEEKMYLSDFSKAEDVINALKEKNSTNKEDISILEKYEKESKELSTVEDCVNNLYKEEIKTVKVANNNKKTTTNEKASYEKSTYKNIGINLIKPVSGTITSRFGIRSRDNHKGIDIAAPKGTSIKAAASGTVIHSGNKNDGYGNYIILSNGNGVQTYYAHCSKLLVQKGEKVSQGQVIAEVGSTGISTGNHLHFEVRLNGVAQNPQNYVYK